MEYRLKKDFGELKAGYVCESAKLYMWTRLPDGYINSKDITEKDTEFFEPIVEDGKMNPISEAEYLKDTMCDHKVDVDAIVQYAPVTGLIICPKCNKRITPTSWSFINKISHKPVHDCSQEPIENFTRGQQRMLAKEFKKIYELINNLKEK